MEAGEYTWGEGGSMKGAWEGIFQGGGVDLNGIFFKSPLFH